MAHTRPYRLDIKLTCADTLRWIEWFTNPFLITTIHKQILWTVVFVHARVWYVFWIISYHLLPWYIFAVLSKSSQFQQGILTVGGSARPRTPCKFKKYIQHHSTLRPLSPATKSHVILAFSDGLNVGLYTANIGYSCRGVGLTCSMGGASGPQISVQDSGMWALHVYQFSWLIRKIVDFGGVQVWQHTFVFSCEIYADHLSITQY